MLPAVKKSVWTEAQKKFIRDEFVGWLECLNLTPMVTRYVWKEENEASRQETSVCFRVFGQWPYREAALHSFPAALGGDKETMSMYLLHEAFHVLLRPMTEHRLAPQNFYADMEEMVTEALTAYVWHQRQYDKRKDEEIARLTKSRKR